MVVKSPLISTKHGFFTREGEEGKTDFVRDSLGAAKLITAKQVHGVVVHHVSEEGFYECDALIADKPGIAVGVFTADCAPILFYDKNAGLVAAAHAGWKGARYGIAEATIHMMQKMGAKDIAVVVGPCIHQKSYEVDEVFRENFIHEANENAIFFMTGKMLGKYQFNLPGYVENKLKMVGIGKVEVLNEDTLSQPDKFFSYRRGTLAGANEGGRQISAICLK